MKKTIKKIRTTFSNMDKVLFFSTLILIVFGTLNIVTASSREAVINSNTNMFYFFFKHMVILFAGLVAFLILLNIKTKEYKGWMVIIFPIIVALNAYLVLKGVSTRGANNWIDLKFLKVQPSEFAKPILIITMGCLFNIFYKKLNNKKEKHTNEIWTILGISLIFPILVFLQKDLGTAMILMGIFFVEFIFSPIKKKINIKLVLFH